ncbi:MAG: hypothetical protein JXR31_03935 [Prolixibacteraceae bacterium]|nr:hypothetical protein [Prolixibacteraceae bacterium]
MKKILVVTAIAVFVNVNLFAQDDSDDTHNLTLSVPEVALVDIEGGSGSVVLSVEAPTEAGNPLNFSNANNNDLWLNYSSIVGTETSRTVSAKISSGSVPSGLLLKVTAGAFSGSGNGTLGSSTGQITLSSTDQNVITTIGSCYTGNGASNGHNLAYVLELNSASGSYALLEDVSTNLTIQYTISDN